MVGSPAKICSVIVCIFQNEGSIPTLCQVLLDVERALAARGVDLEVIFAEDGSTDQSFSALEQRLDQFRRAKLVKLTRNFGSTRAFNAGLRHASGDCIACLSADLQDDPHLVVAMVDEWLKGARYVISERVGRHDPLTSRAMSNLYYRITRWLLFPAFPAGGFDVFLLDRQFFPVILSGERNMNVQALTFWIGLSPVVIPYVRKERAHGKSRWTLAKKMKHFIDTLTSFSFAPLRLVSLVGLLAAIFSFAYGTSVVVVSLARGNPVPGWSSTMTVLAFFFGIIMLMLSIIGEYVWRILDQVRPRPECVIDRVFPSAPAARNPLTPTPLPRGERGGGEVGQSTLPGQEAGSLPSIRERDP